MSEQPTQPLSEDATDIPTTADLEAKALELHKARGAIELQQVKVEGAREALNKTAEGQRLIRLRGVADELDTGRVVIETELRSLLRRHFAANGDKKPAPGLGIQQRKFLTYSNDEALEYAIQHKMAPVLKLNKSAFEKVAEALGLPFVDIGSKITATIAKDLSEYEELPF